jgi:hypothetical protein
MREPVVVQQGLVAGMEIQVPDELLQVLGRHIDMGLVTVFLGLRASEQAVVHLVGGAVAVPLALTQVFDQADLAGKMPGPGFAEQSANQVVVGFALPVRQHGLGQALLLHDDTVPASIAA